MKRIFWMLAALFVAGCEQSPIEEQSATGAEEFYATFENDSDSRTFLDEQLRLRWTADDRITIFKKEAYNREFKFTGVTGSNAGGFAQVSVDDDFYYGAALPYNYAAYPHSNTTTFHEDGYFTLTMPAEQSYAESSVGLGANTMVAASETGKLVFKNVGGFLRVQLYGADQSVKKITLSSIAGEALAGEAKIYASLTDDPTCTMVGTTSSIVLTCTEAVTVNTTEDAPVAFWIVVPPCTLSKGYKVTVENADGNTQEFLVNKEKTFTRNVYSTLKRELTMGQTVDPSSAVPSHQIWYTSSDETMIEPTTTGESVFGATISSHTYRNGLGVITFSGNVTKVGDNAFKGKTKLVTISLPETVTEIGRYAFQNCTRLTEISAPKATTVGDYAFDNCAQLTSVPFASNLTRVRQHAFSACRSLTSLNLKNVSSLGSYAFSECSNLEQVTLLALKGTIGGNAFSSCSKLKEINIPESVTEIEGGAFAGCSSLTSVYISDLAAWCGISFTSSDASPCSNGAAIYLNGKLLTDVTIPDSVTKIGDYVFYNCLSLKSVTIPEGVTTIGGVAFKGCSSLTSVTIPESVKEIGASAFRICSSLTEITIPESVTTLGHAAFQSCSSLKEITIPESVTEIRSSTFRGCSSLTSVIIPESVTTIGDEAFAFCSSLTEITIPKSVTEIGSSAFSNCSSLTSVYCKRTTPPILGDFYVFFQNASDRKIYVPASDDDSIINAYKSAAYWSTYASSIVEYDGSLPNNEIHYTATAQVVPSENAVFGAIYLPGQSTYDSTTQTGVLKFDGEVTTIDGGAFLFCSSLISMTIPESVTKLGDHAFFNCSALTTVVIPESVTEFTGKTFAGCSSLSSVTIPAGVRTIGAYTFERCSSLTEITIPDGVTSIGMYAFEACSSLTSIYCKPTTPPTLGLDVFIGTTSRTIYVPAADDDSIINAYKVADGWSEYADAIAEYEFE
ncbi:MAG: leucine-rich repeat domain-containing protein [Alistipes sp.]|nr:leucine-rich repeat domain-containing protein [Alistipes sp.]